MVLPPYFRNDRERVIASFDAVDLASGTGFVKYFLLAQEDSAAETYHISDSVLFSDEVRVSQYHTGASEGSPVKTSDKDFDLSPFNLPRTIKGIATLNIPYIFDGLASANTKEAYLLIKLRKWDGSSETEIASVQTETLSLGATEVTDVWSLNMEVPKTPFKKGDVLRVTVETYQQTPGAGADGTIYYGISPNDEEFTEATLTAKSSVSFINIPYEIDL
ncbi:hypothetical protein KAR91_74285 [Candidatus Pacearchaeota archaeon]|nr:hypothetical protein [Candidatus Pacearchaeota archaeon]